MSVCRDGTSPSWPARRRHCSVPVVLVACALGPAVALAGELPTRGEADTSIDRTAVRFYAAETGGVAYPRFISQRTLAFEARLAEMTENPEGIGDGYDERDLREALDRHVSEEVLSNLADRLIADSPPDKRPSAADLSRVENDVAEASVERLGGQGRVDQAARAEQLDEPEVEAIFRRGALAAWYIDRALTPILHPTEEQLREVFRTSATPYRGSPFPQVRAALERWFVVERVRVTESAFLQGARSRIRVLVTP